MSITDPRPEDYWEDFYASREQRWSGQPNAVLVSETSDLIAGSALDVGCGEGHDAIWLAEQGWQVAAVDIARTALARGAERAIAAGLGDRISWQQHDLTRTFPAGAYDLVSAHFLHSTVADPRGPALRAAAAAVAPGGLLLIVSHAATPPWGAADGEHHRFPSPGETLADLRLDHDAWKVVVLDSRERVVRGPDGQDARLDDGIVELRKITR